MLGGNSRMKPWTDARPLTQAGESVTRVFTPKHAKKADDVQLRDSWAGGVSICINRTLGKTGTCLINACLAGAPEILEER